MFYTSNPSLFPPFSHLFPSEPLVARLPSPATSRTGLLKAIRLPNPATSRTGLLKATRLPSPATSRTGLLKGTSGQLPYGHILPSVLLLKTPTMMTYPLFETLFSLGLY